MVPPLDVAATVTPTTKAPKEIPKNLVIPEKKVLTKAERRAIQEQQKAAKQLQGSKDSSATTAKSTKTPISSSNVSSITSQLQQSSLSSSLHHQQQRSGHTSVNQAASHAPEKPSKIAKSDKKDSQNSSSTRDKGGLFGHLAAFEYKTTFGTHPLFSGSKIHPAILQLALKLQSGQISGSTSRCVAMLQVFEQVIRDYVTPDKEVLKRHLEVHLRPMINYLKQYRPLSVSMGNAIRYLKTEIAALSVDLTDAEAKSRLITLLRDFLQTRIHAAGGKIAETGRDKIFNGDVVLVYSSSIVVERTMLYAAESGRKFTVIVADYRPRFEGREMMKRLVAGGVNCRYVLLSGISYVLSEVTKVFLGAHTLFTNGSALARAGTATIALMATTRNIPVIFCCEAYKFSERVQLDAVTQNELGDSQALIASSPHRQALVDCMAERKNLRVLNLVYDLTPPDYITMIISEIGMVPVTSVPVVLREYNAYNLN